MADLIDRLIAECAWGQIAPGAVFHAFDRTWWDEERWQPRCNRRVSYGDMQLASLDTDPGEKVCANKACQNALRARGRVLAAEAEAQETALL